MPTPTSIDQLQDGEEVPQALIPANFRTPTPPSNDLDSVPDGTEVTPDASQLRSAIESNPWFPITHETARVLFNADQKKGFLGRAGETIGAIPSGVAAIGRQIGEAHNEMSKVPFPTSGREVERLSNTITEAGAEGALNTAGLARRAGRNFWDWLAEKATGADDEAKIADYVKELKLKQQVDRTARGLPDTRPDNYDPSAPSFVLKHYGDAPPYEKAAQALSLPLDPTFMVGAGALGALGKTAAKIPLVAKATELAAPVTRNLMNVPGAFAKAASEGVERLGTTVKNTAGLPEKLVAEKLGGTGITHFLTSAGAMAGISGHGGPVAAAAAVLKSAQLAGSAAEQIGGFLNRLADTSGDMIRSRLLQLAQDPATPAWMKVAAGKMDALKIGDAAQFVTDLGKGAVEGGATGAALGQAAGSSPEERGQMIGSGIALGAAGKSWRIASGHEAAARRVMADLGAKQRFLEKVISPIEQGGSGLSLDEARTIDDATATTVGHAADLLGDSTKWRVIRPGEAMPGAHPDAAAAYDPIERRVSFRLGDTDANHLHEIAHAVDQAVGAPGEARLLIDSLFSKDQRDQFANQYAAKLARNNDPATVAATTQQLNDRWSGDQWVYNEIYAEAGYGTFKAAGAKYGPSAMQGLLGANRSVWQHLGDMARSSFLNTLGDFFHNDGALKVPRGALFNDPAVYSNPQLRKLIVQHLNEVRQHGVRALVSNESVTVNMPAALLGKHPQAPKPMLMESGITLEDSKGNLRRSPVEERRRDKQRTQQTAEAIKNAQTLPKGDPTPEVAPRISGTGEKEVTGTKISALLNKIPSFGPFAKGIAAAAENLMGTGKAFRAGYFAVGTSEGGSWRKSVARNSGDLPWQQIDLAPFEFRIDQKNHALITGLSITAADRKMARWSQDGRLDDLWGGDPNAFRTDLMTYLKNHAEDRAGAEGIGDKKRDALNVFLLGKTGPPEYNPLREGLPGKDRNGIIRSLRLDRISSLEQSQHVGWQAEYTKKKINYSPRRNAPIPRLPKKMERDTDQRGWYDWQKNLVQERAAMAQQGNNLVDVPKPQAKLPVDENLQPKGAESSGPHLEPGYEPDDATGMPTFYPNSGGVSYDQARGLAQSKAAAKTAREVVLAVMEADAAKSGQPFDREAAFKALGRSSSEPEYTKAARLAESLVLADPVEFEQKKASQNYPPSVIAAAEAARARLPIIPSNQSPLGQFAIDIHPDGWPDRKAFWPTDPRFALIANASEGPVIHDRDSGYVYKITFPSFYQNDVTGPRIGEEPEGRRLITKRASGFFDILNKLDRQNALRDTLPIELQGFFHAPKGYPWYQKNFLVLKMPKMERDATKAEALEWIRRNGVGGQKTKLDETGAIHYDPVGRDQPLARDHYDNHYQLLDFREGEQRDPFTGRKRKTGKYPNLMRDSKGNVLLMDTAPYPIDEELAKRVPDLSSFVPLSEEAAKHIAYSPSRDPQAIKSAAIEDPEGKIWEGPLHIQAMDRYWQEHKDLSMADISKFPQGFVTNSGEFLNREQAAERATQTGQIERPANELHADNIAYSPERDQHLPGADDQGSEKHLEDKARALEAKYPEIVPPHFTVKAGKARADQVSYDLINSPKVKEAIANGGLEAGAKVAAPILVKEFKKFAGDPDVQAGRGWYANVRDRFQQLFGANLELFGQLLGATSARTPVLDNFRQALTAIRKYSAGDYDALIRRYNAHLRKNGDSDKGFEEIPLKDNGAKYNANSSQVLRVLHGSWLDKVQAPKTPNFAGNLTGRTNAATIDVWIGRQLRRLLYDNGKDRWRLLPEQEKPVDAKDFQFGQLVFAKAAKALRLSPDDLQAVMWFAEKKLWGSKGWTQGSGAELSSFEAQLDKLTGDEVQQRLGFMGVPERYTAGITTYKSGPFTGETKTLFNQTRTALRKAVAKIDGLLAARVNPSTGFYMGGQEPCFDFEATISNPDAFDTIAKHIFQIGKDSHQEEVFVSRVVDPEHPNARPGLEIGFKRALSDADTAPVMEVLRANGIHNFSVAKDQSGRAIGVRSQYVPEISARYEGARHLDPAKWFENQAAWVNQAVAIISALDEKLVSYKRMTYFDTRVYGTEEKGWTRTAETAAPAKPSLHDGQRF